MYCNQSQLANPYMKSYTIKKVGLSFQGSPITASLRVAVMQYILCVNIFLDSGLQLSNDLLLRFIDTHPQRQPQQAIRQIVGMP